MEYIAKFLVKSHITTDRSYMKEGTPVAYHLSIMSDTRCYLYMQASSILAADAATKMLSISA